MPRNGKSYFTMMSVHFNNFFGDTRTRRAKEQQRKSQVKASGKKRKIKFSASPADDSRARFIGPAFRGPYLLKTTRSIPSIFALVEQSPTHVPKNAESPRNCQLTDRISNRLTCFLATSMVPRVAAGPVAVLKKRSSKRACFCHPALQRCGVQEAC